MIKLILITAIAAGVAFLVVRLVSGRASGETQDEPLGEQASGRRRPGLATYLLVGVICAVVAIDVLPRFGISVMGLFQKLLAFLPLIRAFLPF